MRCRSPCLFERVASLNDSTDRPMGSRSAGKASRAASFTGDQDRRGSRVTGVWSDRETFEKFAQEKIGPITQEVGIPGPPKSPTSRCTTTHHWIAISSWDLSDSVAYLLLEAPIPKRSPLGIGVSPTVHVTPTGGAGMEARWGRVRHQSSSRTYRHTYDRAVAVASPMRQLGGTTNGEHLPTRLVSPDVALE